MKRFLSFIFALVVLVSMFIPTLSASALTLEDILPADSEEIVSLEDKTVIVVGNSMVYYGNCVISGDEGNSDIGYLYQLISANDDNATVLDYTYPGRTLEYIYENHLAGLDPEICNSVDYVIMSESTQENFDLVNDCTQIMELFPNAVDSVFMCHPIMYERNHEGTLGGVSQLREIGVKIVEWGKLVYDIYTGAVDIPFAIMGYDRCTFIKDNVGYNNGKGYVGGSKEGDDKHPNPLSGYIAAQMVYTAITNRSALFTDYSFCSDSSIHEAFDFDNFISAHYNGDKTTNFDVVFSSSPDMIGIQTLINKYNENEGRHCLAVAEGIPVSCVTGGLTDGVYCDVCSKIFKQQELIPATGQHTVVYDNQIDPTCTVAGKTSGAHCSVCQKVLIFQKTIEATGHTLEKSTVAATTLKDGSKIKSCSVCGYVASSTPIAKISSVSLSKTNYTYTGKTKSPTVIANDSNGKELKKGDDYTVKYLQSSRKNTGYYEVQVTFKGDYSGTKTLGFQIAPKKTTDLEMKKSTTSTVTLSWDKMAGATGYTVYQYYPSKKTYKKIKTVTGTSYTVKKKSAGTKYYYAVRAYADTDDGKLYGNYSDVLTVATKPKKPTVALTAGNDKATVSWKKVSGASGYNIYMASSKNGTYKKVGSATSKKTKITVKNLKSNKTYYFKVKAYKNADGKKVYSSWSTVKGVRVK